MNLNSAKTQNGEKKAKFYIPKGKEWSNLSVKELKVKILELAREGNTFVEIAQAMDCSAALLFKIRKSDPIFDRDLLKIMAANKRDISEKYELTEHEKQEAQEEKRVTEGPFLNGRRLSREQVDSIVDEVAKGIRFGLELDYACMRASISKKTLKQIMADDKEVMLKINKARAENMAWWIDKVRKGAEKNWRAAVVYLERIFPHIWGEVKQVEVTQRKAMEENFSEVIDVTPVDKSALERIKSMSNEELLQMEQKLSIVELEKQQ